MTRLMRMAQILNFSGTYRIMGPLMVPAKALSSIFVRYLFLCRSLPGKHKFKFSKRKFIPHISIRLTEVRHWHGIIFPNSHHCTFLYLFSLISEVKHYRKGSLSWCWFKLDGIRFDGVFFKHTAPSLHISLNPLNLIRIIDLWGACLLWSWSAGISSPLRAGQAPRKTPVCKDPLVTNQWLNYALIRTWAVCRCY